MKLLRGKVFLKIECARSPAVFSMVESEESRRLTHVLMPVYDNAFTQHSESGSENARGGGVTVPFCICIQGRIWLHSRNFSIH